MYLVGVPPPNFCRFMLSKLSTLHALLQRMKTAGCAQDSFGRGRGETETVSSFETLPEMFDFSQKTDHRSVVMAQVKGCVDSQFVCDIGDQLGRFMILLALAYRRPRLHRFRVISL